MCPLVDQALPKWCLTGSSKSQSGRKGQQIDRFSVAELLEMLQTEGSDIEEASDDDDDDDLSEGSEELSDSDVDYWSVQHKSEEVSDEGDVLSGNLSQHDVMSMTADQFLQFMLHDWHQNFSFFPAVPSFSGTPGLHVPRECHTPIDFFDQIMDNKVLHSIVEETNRYAKENLAARGELKTKSIFKQWKDEGISANELIGFLAICVHMGLVHKPEVKDYWITNPILQSPFAASIMSRDKFNLILAMLHVSNNADYVSHGQAGHDPLHKIRPVYTHLQETFRALYTPQENVCVDEAVCAWRGKSKFRVYMKSKPVRWGFKLYKLCESDTGYLYNFEIFAAEPGLSNRPVDVVMRLAEPLLDEGRTVYVDSCPELADALVARDTHCVGTVRANCRGMPPQLKTLHLPQRGHVQAFRQGAVAVLRWMDRKPVHVITTKIEPTIMVDVTTRRGQTRKPAAVQDYILNMAGVNKSDQLLSYMPLNRKTMKWWKKLFFHLFTLTLIQGSILYNVYLKGRKQPRMPLKNFVMAVGNSLCERFHQGVGAHVQAVATAPVPGPPVPGPSCQTPTVAVLSRLSGKGNEHFSCPLPLSKGGKKGSRHCHVCTARSKRHRDVRMRKTSNWCRRCNVPLCDKLCQPGKQVTCFQLYHSVSNFTDY